MSESQKPSRMDILLATIRSIGGGEEMDANLLATNSGLELKFVRDSLASMEGNVVVRTRNGIYTLVTEEEPLWKEAGKSGGRKTRLPTSQTTANLDKGGAQKRRHFSLGEADTER